LAEIEYPALSPDDPAVRIPDYEKINFKKSESQFFGFLLTLVLPRFLKTFISSFEPKPVINNSACIRCGDCTQICASKAMCMEGEGKERHVVINYKMCIRCFCCHEICPAKAIDVTKRRLT
jgi:formate hydrogenlyase subunit 6/NADH:ubiquinone oxidoreductase subunit I